MDSGCCVMAFHEPPKAAPANGERLSPLGKGVNQTRASTNRGAIDSICSITSLMASGCLSGG